jgi:hypothetical protein
MMMCTCTKKKRKRMRRRRKSEGLAKVAKRWECLKWRKTAVGTTTAKSGTC